MCVCVAPRALIGEIESTLCVSSGCELFFVLFSLPSGFCTGCTRAIELFAFDYGIGGERERIHVRESVISRELGDFLLGRALSSVEGTERKRNLA